MVAELMLALTVPGTYSVSGPNRAPTDSRADTVYIEYIAHASFIIESPGGHRVLIDPYASRVWLGYDFPESIAMDAVLITHPHYDHDAGHFRGQPFPWDTTTVPTYRSPGVYRLPDITITGIEGKHADPYGKEFGQINTIWIVEVGGLRIAHIGDNGPLTEANVREMGVVDILMLPIDGEYHILKAHELDAIRTAVNPPWLVPMHYRIGELERSPESPSDLGPIEPWLEDQTGVRRVANRTGFTANQRPSQPEVIVFRHSPRIPRP